jgi:hypothetical protein
MSRARGDRKIRAGARTCLPRARTSKWAAAAGVISDRWARPRHLPRAFGICRGPSASGERLRHVGTASAICRSASAFAERRLAGRHLPRCRAFSGGQSAFRHLRRAVWRVGICRGESALAGAFWPLPICRGLRHLPTVGFTAAFAEGLPHLGTASGIWGRSSPFGDVLRHLPSGFGICRCCLAPADGLRHLPGAIWRVGICRMPFGGSANAEVSGICRGRPPVLDICPRAFLARTFVRVSCGLGHLSGALDICPQRFRARTFVRGRFAAGHLSAVVRGGCPDGPVGACLVRAMCFLKPLCMKCLQNLVRVWSGPGQGSVRASVSIRLYDIATYKSWSGWSGHLQNSQPIAISYKPRVVHLP